MCCCTRVYADVKRVRGGFFLCCLEIDFRLFDKLLDGRYNSDGRISYKGFNVVWRQDASTVKGLSKLRAKGLKTGAGPKEMVQILRFETACTNRRGVHILSK